MALMENIYLYHLRVMCTSFHLLFFRGHIRLIYQTMQSPQSEQHSENPLKNGNSRDGQNGRDERDVEAVELDEAEVARGDLEVLRATRGGHELHEPGGVVEGRVAPGREQVRQAVHVRPVLRVVPGRNIAYSHLIFKIHLQGDSLPRSRPWLG